MTVATAPRWTALGRDRPGWLVLLAFLAAASVLGLASRATVVSGHDLAAVWPSAGITVLWLLVRRAAPISIDTAVMLGAMLVFGIGSGLDTGFAAVLAFAHTAQTVIIVELMRRTLPDLWGCGGTRALDSPRRLAAYLASVGIGVVISTVVAGLGWQLVGHPTDIWDLSLWFGRNLCGVLVVATPGLLLLRYLAQPPPRPPLWEGNRLELYPACFTSLALYLVVFVGGVDELLFLLLGAVIWCGVRFGTLMTAMHVLVLGYVATAATLAGNGPFSVEAPAENALLVQLFVIATAATGLALSTGIDERQALNRELRQTSDDMTYQAQLLHAVVNSMAEGLAVVDDAGRWLLRNPAATRVGGLAGDLRTMLAQAPGDQDPLALALAGETVRDMELLVSDPPGTGRILAVSAAPLPRDSVTERARAVLIFRDATVEHARRVDLTAFADVVAHDLRNPLAGIDSWTEMMANELGDGEVEGDLVRRYIDRVATGTRRMKHLIDDLLDRAVHDAALKLRRVDVAAMVAEVAHDHGANGYVRIGHVPEVQADPALVRQVIDNLLGNALKFVPPGAEPRVLVSGRRTDSGTVAVTVADEGIGLPDGDHDDLFEPHTRAHPTYDGRGLGLAICRRIVERHGGAITARDNPGGRGAVFEFTLPAPD